MIADFFEISQKFLTSLFYGAAAPGSGGVRTAGTLTPALLGLIPEFFVNYIYKENYFILRVLSYCH